MCADGRSCEFFLMCWMSAGLLDGSCGGIMFACCQRRDPKALTDYNLIESPRDQSRPLPLDLYTDTASDDRKSFLSKTHALRTHCTHSRAHRKHDFFPCFFTFFLSFSLCAPLYLINRITTHVHSHVHRACITTFLSLPHFLSSRKRTLFSLSTFHSSS